MFIIVYEFEVKNGREEEFKHAWLEVTKAIYKICGSLGSRLHLSETKNVLVAYAQWPSREHKEKNHNLEDEQYLFYRQKMSDCLVESRIVYQMDVMEDYLQDFK